MNINLLTDEVLYVLIGIVAVLIISTFITKIMKQKNNTSGLKEVEMRIRSWWVMFIILHLHCLFTRQSH